LHLSVRSPLPLTTLRAACRSPDPTSFAQLRITVTRSIVGHYSPHVEDTTTLNANDVVKM